MKNIIKTSITLGAIFIFVMLNWATSQEYEEVTLMAEVTIFDNTKIILDNQDDIAITDAYISLIGSSPDNNSYNIEGYNLAALSKDTIDMMEFISIDSIPYPDTIAPASFNCNFPIEGSNDFASFYHEF